MNFLETGLYILKQSESNQYLVPARSRLDCHQSEAFMKSQYVEFKEIACHGNFTKNGVIQTDNRPQIGHTLNTIQVRHYEIQGCRIIEVLETEFIPKTE